MSTELQDLVNSAVFLSTEMQSHFGRLIADATWEVDFTADPQLTFSSENGPVLRTRPHLLGSESHGTWLWGWDNINDFPEPVVDLSHQVRRFGAGESVAELTTAELELDDELALRLTLAAKAATGTWAHYPAAAGAGTTVWLLVDAPELTLPAPQVKATVRALMQGLTLTTVDDHRAALEAYVARRGIPIAPLAEDGVRLLFADGSADLSFDDQRRISNCEVQSPLEVEAAEQFAEASPGAAASDTRPAPSEAPSSKAETAPAGTPAAEQERKAPAAKSEEQPVQSHDQEAPAEAPSRAEAPAPDEAAARADAPVQAPAPAEPVEPAASAPEETPTETSPEQESPAEAAASSREDERPADATTPAEPREPKEDARDSEADEAQPKKKKGLFSKLFGR
ncbi:DUF6882 domain-containing protein [Brevibacterium sp.]|uniref:DUF6882 domain-containing protein n=1 Tax=Brevibacterium sp. TaxID=1701 RepID=UPI002812235E|nr:DUF6882 domain-containing protein [Brevibacterium sp.]